MKHIYLTQENKHNVNKYSDHESDSESWNQEQILIVTCSEQYCPGNVEQILISINSQALLTT